MIISNEYHDLIKELEKANDEEGKAIRALKNYMSSGRAEKPKTLKLTKLMADAGYKVMNLRSRLNTVREDK
jgi:hypothetical protein